MLMEKEFVSRLTYPDPFSPSGIEFNLPTEARITLKLLNDTGDELVTLADQQSFGAGMHRIDLGQHGYIKGVFFYRLTIDRDGKTIVDTKRIVLTS